jgi:hypothetical protein
MSFLDFLRGRKSFVLARGLARNLRNVDFATVDTADFAVRPALRFDVIQANIVRFELFGRVYASLAFPVQQDAASIMATGITILITDRMTLPKSATQSKKGLRFKNFSMEAHNNLTPGFFLLLVGPLRAG